MFTSSDEFIYAVPDENNVYHYGVDVFTNEFLMNEINMISDIAMSNDVILSTDTTFISIDETISVSLSDETPSVQKTGVYLIPEYSQECVSDCLCECCLTREILQFKGYKQNGMLYITQYATFVPNCIQHKNEIYYLYSYHLEKNIYEYVLREDNEMDTNIMFSYPEDYVYDA
jgi:hypothetical protein